MHNFSVLGKTFMLLYSVLYGEKMVTTCQYAVHCQEKISQQHSSQNMSISSYNIRQDMTVP